MKIIKDHFLLRTKTLIFRFKDVITNQFHFVAFHSYLNVTIQYTYSSSVVSPLSGYFLALNVYRINTEVKKSHYVSMFSSAESPSI